MKRSISVPLIFLGTLGTLGALSGCSEEPTSAEVQVDQNFYATLDDCQRDWGTEAENCQRSLTTTTVNGQDTVASGFTGAGTGTGTVPATGAANSAAASGYTGGGGYFPYLGPRYFWHRTENGGYPMALDSAGNVRRIFGSSMTPSGAKFAAKTYSSRTRMPMTMASSIGSKSVSRSGFGSSGRGASSGG